MPRVSLIVNWLKHDEVKPASVILCDRERSRLIENYFFRFQLIHSLSVLSCVEFKLNRGNW